MLSDEQIEKVKEKIGKVLSDDYKELFYNLIEYYEARI